MAPEMETPATEEITTAVPLLNSQSQPENTRGSPASPPAGRRDRTTTMLTLLLGLFAGRRGASMLVRQTAARQLEDWRADWGYSLPVVILDMMWNLVFVAVSVVTLLWTAREKPNVPLRFWICVYAFQCVIHIVLVWLEYWKRNRRVIRDQTMADSFWFGHSEDSEGSDVDSESYTITGDAIRWEQINTTISYMWWVVGFCWLVSDFKILLHSAPRLFWLGSTGNLDATRPLNLFLLCNFKDEISTNDQWCTWGSALFPTRPLHTRYNETPNLNFATLFAMVYAFDLKALGVFNNGSLALAFLAIDVFFAFIAFLLACLFGLGVCFCFPCIIAFLYIIGGREGASEADITVLPKYKFKAFSDEEQSDVGAGRMIPIETNDWDFSAERVLLAEDADCCICLSSYEDGAELLSLLCNHHFHSKCIIKWLRMNPTCPLCKHNIKRNENEQV